MAHEETRRRFEELSRTVVAGGRVRQMARFTQHGTTSTLDHTVSVAYQSLLLARTLRLRVDEASLVRGAILHDYFLYDWHDPVGERERWHGFTHPGRALANAERDFDLTPIERDVIKRHMFPFVPIPPRTLEGWLVCMCDKWCTVNEFLAPLIHADAGRPVGQCEDTV